MAIRAVLFDAVGTLFHSRGSVGEIYRDVAAGYGVQADAAMLERQFLRYTSGSGTPIEKSKWRSLVESVFEGVGPFPRFDEFFEEVYEVFRSDRAWLCYPETQSVLEAIRNHGYPMGVVSNFDDRLGSVLDDLGIGAYFDAVTTPYSAGHAKPDSRIFVEAALLLGVEPREALFAGDDLRQDYEAAARAGLQSLLIDRERTGGGRSSHAIRDLTGILALLGIA